MTDKQIIIDGVDVSGCIFYSGHLQEYIGTHKCECGRSCYRNKNCYYKQLKRSEAQCEAMFVTHIDLENKLKAKEQ